MSTLHELERETGLDLANDDYWAQARLNVLRDWIEAGHPETVVDIGCGSGYLSAELARPSRRVIGVDIDPESIAVAKKRRTDAEFFVDDALDLSLDRDMADAVILADLIEHFEDPRKVLSEATRITRPDGRVFVSVPGLPWLFGPHDENQGHARRYSKDALAETAQNSGLTPARMRYTNFFPLVPYTVLQRVIRKDVPTGVRGGQDSRVIEAGKRALLKLEHSVAWPLGVTLLGEFSPTEPPIRLTTVMTNYEYPPGCGGGGVFTQDLRQALRDRGVAVPLVAGHNPSAWTVNGVMDLMSYPMRSYRALKTAIEVEEPDVINGHFSVPTSLFLPRLKRKFGIPYIVNVMGADVHDPTRYRRIRPLLDVINFRYVLEHADRIVVPSHDLLSRIPDRLHHKTEKIPYFVDTNRFSPRGRLDNRPREPIRLVTVTRLVPRKNLEVAIDVVGRMVESGTNVRYTIVGDGSQRDALEGEVVDRGLSGFIDFTGYVPEDELVDEYRSHDIFLLTSEHEGFGIAILEAMACGLPVVVSASGGPQDFISDDVGVLCEPNNVDGYCTAIEAVRGSYDEMAVEARRVAVEAFDRDAITKRYIDLYRDVAEGR